MFQVNQGDYSVENNTARKISRADAARFILEVFNRDQYKNTVVSFTT